ncbi:hypothetical protein [Thiosocius teredinicola]|uniref:hypothetical protein n=1 Tax=Thiosocius teredinicola TaxID=1973002 RepID=UPI0009914B9F
MILGSECVFYNDYYETLRGLRCAEIGRANTHLERFIDLLAIQLQRMSPNAQQKALLCINTMLAARQRDDSIGLADCLQYELPQTLEEAEFSPTLLNVDLLQRLRAIPKPTGDAGDTERIAAELRSIYREFPQAQGLATYYASQVYLFEQFDDAATLIALDESEGRLTAAGSYIRAIALGKASDANMPQSRAEIAAAYQACAALRDGNIQLGWFKAERGDWPTALQLMQEDIEQGRTGATGIADVGFALAHLEDWANARTAVEEAYKADESMTDRFGWMGWIGYLKGKGTAFFADCLREDETRDRTWIWGQVFAGCLAAARGDAAKAEAEIDAAYTELPGKHSWYCAIGWLLIRSGDTATGCRLMQRDLDQDAMPHFWKPAYAIAQAIHGQRDQASDTVAAISERYRTKPFFPIGYWHVPDAWMTFETLQRCVEEISDFSQLASYSEPAKLDNDS